VAGDNEPWWKDHLTALALPSVFVVATTLRLMGATNGDLVAGMAILNLAGTGNVLIGTVIPFAALFMPIGAAGLAFLTIRWQRRSADVPAYLWAVLGAAGMGSVLFSPWPYTAIGAGFLAALFAVRAWDTRAGVDVGDKVAGLPDGLLYGGLTIAFVCLASLMPPWWPAERLEMKEGKDRAAYVIGEDGNELIVLDEETRKLERMPSDEIERRSYCRTSNAFDELPSLAGLRRGYNEYPTCPR